MGVRVEEDGRSEGWAVMAQIWVESLDNITLRESGLTSIWSLVARRSGNQLEETKQMMVSFASWCSLPLLGVLAADEYRRGAAGWHRVSSGQGELVRGLSCLR